ncbi:heterokaryon incompatibility protein-domain-containing protein [Stachybotrys elegans]|uniref:Heterokaryon incompatibility protein-domain-containing protein n=1 Tax=Stachybotrys elegans TaxID=80388 RepID=A0A8K0WN47_9HYPO|nr:heterokaryon incompatibility protein-domain-containing protein [Stachybotrys elegans]
MYGATSNRGKYSYPSTIGSQHLRLLQPVVVEHRFLAFSISTFRRDAAPSYTAVSYTWGEGDASEIIHVNDQSFPVRLNLWSCLYYMGRHASQSCWTHIWVDAICIDQSNDAEKGDQVRFMDQTYKDAATVSVWLGLISLPYDLVSTPQQREPIRTIDVDGWLDWEDHMEHLANHPYWSRFWVIQEFLLGSRVELCYSNQRLDWEMFQEYLCRKADIPDYFNINAADQNQGKAAELPALSLVMGRHIDKHPTSLQPLYNLIIDHGRSECKDPRDRVFALLGLVTQEEKSLLSRMFPDYSLSHETVVTMAIAHLTQYGPLVTSLRGDPAEITESSDDIFKGLGVEDKQLRRRLLRRAANIDYIGYEPGMSVLQDLAFEEDNPSLYQGSDDIERGESGARVQPGFWRSWTATWKLNKLFPSLSGPVSAGKMISLGQNGLILFMNKNITLT